MHILVLIFMTRQLGGKAMHWFVAELSWNPVKQAVQMPLEFLLRQLTVFWHSSETEFIE
jgi:hypothetical protein